MDAIHREGPWQQNVADRWSNCREASSAALRPAGLFRVALRVWPELSWTLWSAMCPVAKIVMRLLQVVRDVPRVAVAALVGAGLRNRGLERVAEWLQARLSVRQRHLSGCQK